MVKGGFPLSKMKNELGNIAVRLSPYQVESVIINVNSGSVDISVSDMGIKCIDTILEKDLIVGGLNSYLNDLVVVKLNELKSIQEGV